MAGFSSLTQYTQDLIMVQFEFFGKLFIMAFGIGAALYYLHKRKEQKDTPYMLVALGRSILYYLSWLMVYFTPLFIIWLYPQVAIDQILKFEFLFYRYTILVFGIILFVNILFYGPLILAKLGGLNIQSKNANKILDKWLGKYRGLFKRG